MRLELCHHCACRCPSGPSADTMLTTKSHRLIMKLSVIPDVVIRTGRRNLANFASLLFNTICKWRNIAWVLESNLKYLGDPGPRFNIKATSYQYRKSHCGVLTTVLFAQWDFYTGKMTSLYWIGAQDEFRNKQDAGWTEDIRSPQKHVAGVTGC